MVPGLNPFWSLFTTTKEKETVIVCDVFRRLRAVRASSARLGLCRIRSATPPCICCTVLSYTRVYHPPINKQTVEQDRDRISEHFLCNIWKKRNERPNVVLIGVSIRSRNGAPSRKECVVNAQITKASNK